MITAFEVSMELKYNNIKAESEVNRIKFYKVTV